MMLALTSAILPAVIATIVMISSAALPRLALSRPPICGPVFSASASVASPNSPAMGMIASADAAKMTRSPQCRNSAATATGKKSNNSRMPFIPCPLVCNLNAHAGYGLYHQTDHHRHDIIKPWRLRYQSTVFRSG